MPELYDPKKVEEERQMIDNAVYRNAEGETAKDKVKKEHRNKYERFWEKSHSAKLSNIRRYDLSEFRYKDIDKNPQNILVFNGKLLEYMKKINPHGISSIN